MLLNNKSVINITKTLDLTQEQLNKINSIDTLTTSNDNMDQELLKFAISQGLFAALFVWLLIDTRKESKTREESLNKTIEENKKRLWI